MGLLKMVAYRNMDAEVIWYHVPLLIHIGHQENKLVLICHCNGPKYQALDPG